MKVLRMNLTSFSITVDRKLQGVRLLSSSKYDFNLQIIFFFRRLK